MARLSGRTGAGSGGFGVLVGTGVLATVVEATVVEVVVEVGGEGVAPLSHGWPESSSEPKSAVQMFPA